VAAVAAIGVELPEIVGAKVVSELGTGGRSGLEVRAAVAIAVAAWRRLPRRGSWSSRWLGGGGRWRAGRPTVAGVDQGDGSSATIGARRSHGPGATGPSWPRAPCDVEAIIFRWRGAGRLPIEELLGSRPVDALLHQGEAEAVAARGGKLFGETFVRLLPMVGK
jgi:hypothetical protein